MHSLSLASSFHNKYRRYMVQQDDALYLTFPRLPLLLSRTITKSNLVISSSNKHRIPWNKVRQVFLICSTGGKIWGELHGSLTAANVDHQLRIVFSFIKHRFESKPFSLLSWLRIERFSIIASRTGISDMYLSCTFWRDCRCVHPYYVLL